MLSKNILSQLSPSLFLALPYPALPSSALPYILHNPDLPSFLPTAPLRPDLYFPYPPCSGIAIICLS